MCLGEKHEPLLFSSPSVIRSHSWHTYRPFCNLEGASILSSDADQVDNLRDGASKHGLQPGRGGLEKEGLAKCMLGLLLLHGMQIGGYTAKCQTNRSCTSFLWFRGKPRPICFAGPKAQGFQEGQMQREPVSEQNPPPAIRKSSVIISKYTYLTRPTNRESS